MGFFRSFLDQLKKVQDQASTSAKVGIGVTTVLCVALIVGVGYWSAQPNYVPLAINLEPAQAAEIISKLNNAGISNQSNYTTVLVDKSQWDRANMLVSEMLPDSQRAPGDFESSTFHDPKLNAYYQQEHLEKKLAATISRLSVVDSAVVHLNIAKDENFMRSSEPSSASVTVTVRSGMTFTRQHTASVVATVSSSVKGMSSENVKVVDTNGNLLSGGDSGFGSVVSEQYDLRRRIETDLSEQAEWVLERRLGKGKAVVRVSVDVDFTESTTVETTHPESTAKLTESTEKKTESNSDILAQGPAGTSSNFGSTRGLGDENKVLFESETSDITYAQGEIRLTKQESPGKIRRLTVAAMVDLTNPVLIADPNADPKADPVAVADAGAEGTTSANEPIPMSVEDVEELIKAAVGFDEERYDEIKVVETTLVAEDPLAMFDEPEEEQWAQYNQIVRNASLGIAAVLAFIIGFLMLRKMKPVTIIREAPSAVSPERSKRLSEMAALAKQHPEAIANIMSAWINDNKDEEARKAA